MKNTPLALLLLLALCACSTSSPVSVSPPKGAATLELSSLSPEPGETLQNGSVLSASLKYAIPPEYPGEYFVVAQFATTTPNRTFDGTFPIHGYPVLRSNSGTATIEFPMAHVYSSPELGKPIKVWFFLNLRTAPGRSAVVAQVGPYVYSSN